MVAQQLLPVPWIPCELYRMAAAYVDPLDQSVAGIITSNNDAIYTPVIFPVSAMLYEIQCYTGNTTGNFDLGFYTADFTRVTSKGSTAMTAAIQTLTISPDYRVEAGALYYAAIAQDNTGGTVLKWGGTVTNENSGVPIAGILHQSSAFPLPNPAVPIFPRNSTIPVFAYCTR